MYGVYEVTSRGISRWLGDYKAKTAIEAKIAADRATMTIHDINDIYCIELDKRGGAQ
jgi:hypothetical protein